MAATHLGAIGKPGSPIQFVVGALLVITACAWLQHAAERRRETAAKDAAVAASGVRYARKAILSLDSLFVQEEKHAEVRGRHVELPLSHLRAKRKFIHQVATSLERVQVQLTRADSAPPDTLKQKKSAK